MVVMEYEEILHLEEEVWRKELEEECAETDLLLQLESRRTPVEVGAVVECRQTGVVEDLRDQHRPPSQQPRCQP